MTNIFFLMRPTGWSGGGLRRWLSLALVIFALGVFENAQAQQYTHTVSIALSHSVTDDDYGTVGPYYIALDATPPGTLWDVTYTFTNNTVYPLRFIESLTNADIYFQSPYMVQVAASVPADITLQPGGSFTVTFQAGVPTTGVGIPASSQAASIFYSVGRVWDQVWLDDDFDGFCSSPPAVISLPVSALGRLTSGGESPDGIGPDCVYSQDARIVNNLNVPVTVSYAGYTDDGTLAPYISGELCNSSIPKFCNSSLPSPPYWLGDITLAPGEASPVFRMIIGMPWYIGNESAHATGSYAFTWNVTPASAPAPAAPTPIPALSPWALVLLVLGLAGVGGWRIRRGGRP
jgi:hypothetical protein